MYKFLRNLFSFLFTYLRFLALSAKLGSAKYTNAVDELFFPKYVLLLI